MKIVKPLLLLSLFALISCKQQSFEGDYKVTTVGVADVSNYDITLKIEMSKDENKISGKSACNKYFGDFKVKEDGGVELQPIAMTKMFCPETNWVEDDYHQKLNKTHRVEKINNELHILDKEGNILIKAIEQHAQY